MYAANDMSAVMYTMPSYGMPRTDVIRDMKCICGLIVHMCMRDVLRGVSYYESMRA